MWLEKKRVPFVDDCLPLDTVRFGTRTRMIKNIVYIYIYIYLTHSNTSSYVPFVITVEPPHSHLDRWCWDTHIHIHTEKKKRKKGRKKHNIELCLYLWLPNQVNSDERERTQKFPCSLSLSSLPDSHYDSVCLLPVKYRRWWSNEEKREREIIDNL